VSVPPLPVWDEQTKGFWDAAREHVLAVQTCTSCGTASFPPWAACRTCHAREFVWAPTSGLGTIYTWTTVFRSTRPEFADQVPYTLAVVELDDHPGVLVPARFPGIEPLKATIGVRVKATFEDVTPEVTLLRWAQRDQ